MDCKRCAEDLTAFLDSELEPAHAAEVRAHLNGCAACADELRSLREAGEFFTTHNHEIEPRPGSWNVIRAHITTAEPSAPSGFSLFKRGWGIAAAGTALLAAFVLGYVQYQQNQQEMLDRYISAYEKAREAERKSHSLFWSTEGGSQVENPYANNPFVEIKATIDDNPFRSEGR